MAPRLRHRLARLKSARDVIPEVRVATRSPYVNTSDTSYFKAVVFTLLALGMATLYWLALSLASHGMLPFAMRPFDFSMEGNSIPGIGFSINVIATSVITTWIFIKSRQSTFVAILLHATGNFCLFLVIKSFHHSNDLSGVQMIFNAIIVPLAVVAGIALWRAPVFESTR
jgi:hypothetical protein